MSQQPQPQPINVDISQATDIVCERCQAPYFMEGMRIKKLSRFVSPTGQDEMINIQVLLCMACGLEMGQPIPEQVPNTEEDVQ